MRSKTRATLIAVIAVLTVLVTVPSLIAVQRVGALSACQSDWNQSFAEAYRARLDSSQLSSQKLDRIILSVDTSDRAAFQQAVDDYVRARNAQIADQRKNPYPQLPEQYCGDDDGDRP